MSATGEQSPAPKDEADSSVVRLHDQPSSSRPPELQDVRPHLNKLAITEPSVSIPETSSCCAHSACETISIPLSAVMRNSELLRARNVVVFGESGVGKSSVINMIAGENVTQTSNNAVGCTFRYSCHNVFLDGASVNLWDTVGLDEGTEGTVPAKQAESSLKAFLRHITEWNGIDLLLYCVRGTRVRQALLRNYNLFYAAICRKKVPVALVVTGLENYEGDMEEWWTKHEQDLIRHGMRFDAHACVTTICSDHPAIQSRLILSRDVLRDLVRTNFDAVAWCADEATLISASLPDVRALLRAREKRVVPLIVVCDATEDVNQSHLFPVAPGSRDTLIGDRKYQCLYVDSRQLRRDNSKEAAQRPDLLIFYADADSEPDQIWTTLEQFHLLFGGETCPMIVVFRGLDNLAAAIKMWGFLSSTHDGKIIAHPIYYPGPYSVGEVEIADDTLAALIEERCLVKFEENLTKFQKFCRHSKHFFTRRT